jgi:molybdopterin-guanine dinucleotide biosynthesis protein B
MGSHERCAFSDSPAGPGSGKTTLIERIIPRLVERGLVVSLVKHAHHTRRDRPAGKDSYRHRQAGCREVMVSSGTRWALMHELRGTSELTLPEALDRLSPCDLALVEGYKAYPIPKLEIWRDTLRKPLLCLMDPQILAIATDSAGALPARTADRLPVSRFPTLMQSQHSSPKGLPPVRCAIDLRGCGE